MWGGEVPLDKTCVIGALRSNYTLDRCRCSRLVLVVIFIYYLYHDRFMATAKTGSFYLTETVTLPAASAGGTRVQSSIDLGAYVNVATGQAVAVEEVDFIYQHGGSLASAVEGLVASNATLGVQLTDLNPGQAFIRADDHSLIASGALNIDQGNNVATNTSDLYPDNFGPTSLSEAFLVVNDTLYLVGGVDGGSTIGGADVLITARIKCRVAKLSNKDWMAIAIQSTASDN